MYLRLTDKTLAESKENAGCQPNRIMELTKKMMDATECNAVLLCSDDAEKKAEVQHFLENYPGTGGGSSATRTRQPLESTNKLAYTLIRAWTKRSTARTFGRRCSLWLAADVCLQLGPTLGLRWLSLHPWSRSVSWVPGWALAGTSWTFGTPTLRSD